MGAQAAGGREKPQENLDQMMSRGWVSIQPSQHRGASEQGPQIARTLNWVQQNGAVWQDVTSVFHAGTPEPFIAPSLALPFPSKLLCSGHPRFRSAL